MKLSLLLLGATLSSSAFAQQHLHGSGQALLAQEGKDWMVSFTLPAADVVGFEHAPENKKQRDAIDTFISKASRPFSLVNLAGDCKQSRSTVDVPMDNDGSSHEHHDHDDHHKHEDEHSHHDHEHDEHKHEDEHGHHDHEKAHEHESHDKEHANIEISLQITCKGDVSGVSFPLLNQHKSLKKLSVEWITDNGQGAADVTSPDSLVRF